MIDREYIKLNTSIHTGSNADHLIYDDDGNIQASIEMRLPENIFSAGSGPQKVDKAVMQTSKFRISMEHTPIAQVTLDPELSDETTKATNCQLDVYPYCLLDDNKLMPLDPVTNGNTLSFPHYKDHKVTYKIRVAKFNDQGEVDEYVTLETIDTIANTEEYGVPRTNRFYNLLNSSGVFKETKHMMNMCIQSNHEPYIISGNNVLIHNIGTLEQMLQDAIENAISYASIEDEEIVIVDLADSFKLPDNISPSVDKTNSIYLSELGRDAYFWKWNKDDMESQITNTLKYACKPRVILKEQSLTIEYDSAAFDKIIPILWNTPFVETYDHPEQMTIDVLRKSVWSQPPPKRVYKYGVTNTDDAYNFNLLKDLTCACTNLICNEAMRNTFSFLPWIKVDTKQMEAFKTNNNNTHLWEIEVKRLNISETFTTTELKYLRKGEGDTFLYFQTFGGVVGMDDSSIQTIHYQFEIATDASMDDVSVRRFQEIQMGEITIQRQEGELWGGYTQKSEPVSVHNEQVEERRFSNDTSLGPGTTTLMKNTDKVAKNPSWEDSGDLTSFVKFFWVNDFVPDDYHYENQDVNFFPHHYVMGIPPAGEWRSGAFENRWLPPIPPTNERITTIDENTKLVEWEWDLRRLTKEGSGEHAVYLDPELDHSQFRIRSMYYEFVDSVEELNQKITNVSGQDLTFKIETDTTYSTESQLQYFYYFGSELEVIPTDRVLSTEQCYSLYNDLDGTTLGFPYSCGVVYVYYRDIDPQTQEETGERHHQMVNYGMKVHERSNIVINKEYQPSELYDFNPAPPKSPEHSEELSTDQSLNVGVVTTVGTPVISEFERLDYDTQEVTEKQIHSMTDRFLIGSHWINPCIQDEGDFYDSDVTFVVFPAIPPTHSVTTQEGDRMMHIEGWILDEVRENYITLDTDQTYSNYELVYERERNTPTQTVTTSLNSVPVIPKTLKELYTPNLDMNNGVFYMLDGTTAEVSIGAQEVIDDGDEDEPGPGPDPPEPTPKTFTVQEHVVTRTFRNVIDEEWLGNDDEFVFNGTTYQTTPVHSLWRLQEGVYDRNGQPGNISTEYYVANDADEQDFSTHRESKVFVGNTLSQGAHPDESQYLKNNQETGFTEYDVQTNDRAYQSDDQSLQPGEHYEEEHTPNTTISYEVTDVKQATDYEGQWEGYNIFYVPEFNLESDGVVPGKLVNDYIATYDSWFFVPDVATTNVVTETGPQPNTTKYTKFWKFNTASGTTENLTFLQSTINVTRRKIIEYKVIETTTTITENETSEISTQVSTTVNSSTAKKYSGNVRLSFTWSNLPMVVMSPIASIVLTINGVQVQQEYQPINIVDLDNKNSSLTSSVPIIENYYSLATTLRDLHDELVVVKDSFDDTATYTIANTGGQERVIRLSAHYITKDGSIHQIYIPPNGVFSLQLTFGLTLLIS